MIDKLGKQTISLSISQVLLTSRNKIVVCFKVIEYSMILYVTNISFIWKNFLHHFETDERKIHGINMSE